MKVIFVIKLMIVFIVIFSCSKNEQIEREEIISEVFNSQIGNEEHFGSSPPIPPLPPDFDILNKFETKEQAKKELTSKEWEDYFKEQSNYDERVRDWKKRMMNLNRKIIFNNHWKLSDHQKEFALKFLDEYGLKNEFLEVKTNWDKSDVRNKSKYEIINRSDLPQIELDSISVGQFSISEIGFNYDKNEAIAYYEWICGSLCGGGYIVVLRKEENRWKIEDILNIWVS